jgi:hypothetical protein
MVGGVGGEGNGRTATVVVPPSASSRSDVLSSVDDGNTTRVFDDVKSNDDVDETVDKAVVDCRSRASS